MPTTLTTAPLNGFYIAMADAAGAKTARETRLNPAPVRVEYPNQALGDLIETADGRVVVQVSNKDPRRRSWQWANMGPEMVVAERQHRWLQQLVARTRQSLSLPPFVYVYDGVTGLMNVNRSLTITPSSLSGDRLTITVPTTASQVYAPNLVNGVVEVLNNPSGGSAFPYERRSIVSATSTTLVLDAALSGVLGTSQIIVTWSEPAWWKARILDTTRELRTEGGPPRYTTSLLTFVIEEEIPA